MLKSGVGILVVLLGPVFSSEEIRPSYEIRDESIFIFLQISNQQDYEKVLKYDKNTVVSFSLKCREKDVAGIHYTAPQLNCSEFQKHPENISLPEIPHYEKICGKGLKNTDVIPPKATKNIFIQRLMYNSHFCDSLKVDLNLNYSKLDY